MEKANFLNLNGRDFMKGAIVAVLTAVFATLTTLLETGKLFEKTSLTVIGVAALTAFLGYMTKNLFTNSQGEILTTEKNATPEKVAPLSKILIFAILLSGIGIVNAQSKFKGFFKPVESFEQPYSLGAMSTASDLWLFRPSAAITAVQMNWNKTTKAFDASAFSSAGLGIGYQHFIKTDTEPFNNYGVNLLLLIGKAPETPETSTTEASMSLALVFSALKWINLGPVYDFNSKTIGILTGVQLKF